MIDVSFNKEIMKFNAKKATDNKVEMKHSEYKESFKDTFNKVNNNHKPKKEHHNSVEDNKVEAKEKLNDLVSTLKENNADNEVKEISVQEIETLLKDDNVKWDTVLNETINVNDEEVSVEDVLNQLATLINSLFASKDINAGLQINNNIGIDTTVTNTDVLTNNLDALNNFDNKGNNLLNATSIKNTFSQIITALNNEEIASTLNNEEVSMVKEALSMIFGQALDNEGNKADKGSINDILSKLDLNTEVMDTEKIEASKEGTLSNNFNSKENNAELLKNTNKEVKTENKEFSFVESTTDSKEDDILSKILNGDTALDKISSLQDRLSLKSNFEITEPSVVHKTTVVKDIIKNVTFMNKNAIQELKVKIYPKELGEMTIKILSEEGIMKAEIKATSKETYNLLNSNLNELKKSLSEQNIKIQEVNIGLYQEDATFFSGENKEGFERNNENYSKGSSKIDETSIEVEENNAYVDNSVNMLA